MNTFKTGFENMTQAKAIQKLKRQLRYRAKRPEPSYNILCSGGPFDGHEIRMSIPETATFTVNGVSGCYRRVRDDIQNSRIWGPVSNDVARWVPNNTTTGE